MSKHKLDMIADWARENGIRGYEHLDRKEMNKRRSYGVQKSLERNRRDKEESYEQSKSR